MKKIILLFWIFFIPASPGLADYQIDYGDGSPAQNFTGPPWTQGSQAAIASHTYSTAGVFTITITADLDCDGDGVADSVVTDTIQVDTNPPPSCTSTTISGVNKFEGISGSSDSNVIAVGKKGKIYRFDGSSWSSMTSPSSEDLKDIFVLPDGTAYAVGKKGTVIYYDGAAWSSVISANIPNKELKGVWAASPGEVYAVGKNGSLVVYNGSSWTDISGPAGVGNKDLEKVWGNSSYVYVLGKNGTIYTYDRNTWTWSSNALCSGTDFKDLFVDSAGDILITAKDGKIYLNNGSGCQAVAMAGEELAGIHGSATGEIYAVGKKGVVMYYNGSVWVEQSQGSNDLKDVWVSAAGNAYYAGNNSQVIVCTTGNVTLTGATGSCATMNTISVLFSNDVEQASAEDPGNYTLDNGVTVTAAVRGPANTVTLTTSALSDLTPYTLTVNNVKSLAGIPIASGSNTSFTLNCTNMVAFYRMDAAFWNGTAGEVIDQTGNGLNGTAIGGATTAAAKVCNGAALDGITLSYVEVADNPLLNIPEELTVSLWLKTNVIPTSGLKSILSKDQNYEFHVTPGGHIYWWWNNTAGGARTLTTAASITAGTWHHIAIVYSRAASSQKIYIDGVADVNTSSRSEALFQDPDPLQIGGDQAFITREFDGLIDEVRIYARAQSQAEIQADMNETRPCPSLACSARDNFTIVSYGNQDGQLNWTSDWQESNDDNNPASGDALISGGRLNMNNDTGSAATRPILTREVNLSGAAAATLSFIFSTSAGVDNGDSFRVEVSGDGGSNWTTLETITGNGSPKTEFRSYPIDAFIAGNTQIRLRIQNGYTVANEDVYFYYINVAPVGICSQNLVDHYQILHDGSAVNCQAEPITIRAHDSSDSIINSHTGSIDLTTDTLHGDWTVISGVAANLVNNGSGSATYTFDGSESGEIILGLKDTFPNETVNIDITDTNGATENSGAALPSEDPDLFFAEAGFNFLAYPDGNADGVPDSLVNEPLNGQIGGKASNLNPGAQVLELEAIRTNDQTGQCEAALVGTNTVELAFECLDPAACTGNLVVINGSSIAGNTAGSVNTFSGIPLDFGSDTDTTASLVMTYPEAGRIRLHARYDIPLDDGSGTSSGNLMIGSSNNFVVRPFGFALTALGNPAAVLPGGPLYTSAGTPFTTQIRAVLWQPADDIDNNGIPDNHSDPDPANNADLTDNQTALNFGQETTPEDITLSSQLFLPAGGNDPGLSGNTTVSGFSNGIATSSVNFSEVGIIELAANLSDASYLGAGAVTGKSGHVGRFSPVDFKVNILPDPPTLLDSCAAGFTYLGQPFGYTINPTITITPSNLGGNPTLNYDCGGFWLLPPDPFTLSYTYGDAAGAGPTLTPAGVTAAPAAGDTSNCDGQVVITLNDSFTYSRPALTAPVSPFAAAIDLSISQAQLTDSDGVCLDSGAGCQSFNRPNLSGSNLRMGRSVAVNAYGPETAGAANPLVLPLSVEFYDTSGNWLINSDDNCSQFSYTINPSVPGPTINVLAAPASPVTVSGGMGNLQLRPDTSLPDPDGQPGGSVIINYNFAAWLEPDLVAEAFFGIYRGNDRIINWKEIIR